ncbi:MAG: flagellar protein FlaG [Zetaproteobacteria bacterium]|nr:MAG: flagellar protein FlaG [Zetaproteobacteria bacterium]
MVAITQTTPATAAVAVPASPDAASSGRASVPPPSIPPTPAEKQADPQVTEQRLAEAVRAGNAALAGKNEHLSFGYEKRLNLLYVQIRDNRTGEVIREIPSKDFIRHALAMKESIGLILDKKG